MNYKRIHDRIIARAQNRQRRRLLSGYREQHHIVPRCAGGTDDPLNLVELTRREHFLVHWLLTKLHGGDTRRRLQYALTRFNDLPWQRPVVDRAVKLAKLYETVQAGVGDHPYLMGAFYKRPLRGRLIKAIRKHPERFLGDLKGEYLEDGLKRLATALVALGARTAVTPVKPDNGVAALLTSWETLSAPWERGSVRYFDYVKGFGFIRPDAAESVDVFVSVTRVPPNFGSINSGQPCAYVPEQHPKGVRAKQFALLFY